MRRWDWRRRLRAVGDGLLAVLIIGGIVCAFFTVLAAKAHFAYGDWTCAIKRCVDVK